MATSLQTYSKLLAEQLRINGVKEAQVRDVVALVQQHVRESGEDPVVAFGQPSAYAQQWNRLTPTRWAIRLLGSFAAATGMQAGFLAAGADGGWPGDVSITRSDLRSWMVWVVVFAVVPWTLDVWLSRRLAGGAVPWASAHPEVVRVAVSVGLVIVLGVVLFGFHPLPEGEPVLALPRWTLAAIAAVGLPGLVYFGGPGRQMPRAPGAESWTKRMRRTIFTP